MDLSAKIASRSARVTVIGLGYVGLPLAVAFGRAGFEVYGVDADPEKIRNIGQGHSHISEVPDDELMPLVTGGHDSPGRLVPTTDWDVLRTTDAVLICVPTPLDGNKAPEMSHIMAATAEVATRLHPGELVVLESTTYPGTTEEVVLPQLDASGLQVGKDFFLAFSPERIDPGRRDFTLANTAKVIGGVSPACLRMVQQLYGCIVDQVVPMSSTRAAETVKLLENTFRAVNIALVNEIAIMCEHLQLDVWEILSAAATKPFGYMAFEPGPGLGGHCIPIDPQLLAWKLRTLNHNSRFIELAAEINFSMPEHVVGLAAGVLEKAGQRLQGAKILLLGVAYKRNVGDTRESPAIDIINRLDGQGVEVSYHDPYVPRLEANGRRLESVPLSPRTLGAADCVIIVTDHQSFDWDWIVANSKRIVDTRNATAGVRADTSHVVRLGSRASGEA